MKTIRIKASELVKKIKEKRNDSYLMEKYGLTVRSLPKIKTMLLAKGLVTQEDLGILNSTNISAKIHINALKFLNFFRKRSDDYYLMEKYSLTSEQLKKIYDILIQKGLMSEYEYYYREKKALELQDATPPEQEESTAIDLTGDIAEIFRIPPPKSAWPEDEKSLAAVLKPVHT